VSNAPFAAGFSPIDLSPGPVRGGAASTCLQFARLVGIEPPFDVLTYVSDFQSRGLRVLRLEITSARRYLRARHSNARES
jgi:hypothetical protein